MKGSGVVRDTALGLCMLQGIELELREEMNEWINKGWLVDVDIYSVGVLFAKQSLKSSTRFLTPSIGVCLGDGHNSLGNGWYVIKKEVTTNNDTVYIYTRYIFFFFFFLLSMHTGESWNGVFVI